MYLTRDQRRSFPGLFYVSKRKSDVKSVSLFSQSKLSPYNSLRLSGGFPEQDVTSTSCNGLLRVARDLTPDDFNKLFLIAAPSMGSVLSPNTTG